MVGGNAGGTDIGVAPGARWIAVKIFDDNGDAQYSDIHDGFQWLLNNAAPPDVVNNSWGFPDNAGECLTISQFQQDIVALKAAGIGVVFSAGNTEINESPANYPESIAVGAVDQTQTVPSFSARGPSACDGTVFPELVAPGVNVLTTDLTFNGTDPDSYASATGTSIAGKENLQVKNLSGGEQQRVVIARALINDPAVIIADEPTAHLDKKLAAEFMDILAALCNEGRTVIIATHDPFVHEHSLVTNTIAMRDGRLEKEN